MVKLTIFLAVLTVASVECSWFSPTPQDSLKKLNEYLVKEAHLSPSGESDHQKVIGLADSWLKSGAKHGKALETYLQDFVKLSTINDKNICLPDSYNLLRMLGCNGKVLDEPVSVASKTISFYIERQAEVCYAGYHYHWMAQSRSIDPRDSQWVKAFTSAFYNYKYQSANSKGDRYNGPAGLGAMLRDGNPIDNQAAIDAMLSTMGIDINQMTGICRRFIASPAASRVFAAIDNMDPKHTWIYHRRTDDYHWIMAQHLLCRYLAEEGVQEPDQSGGGGGDGLMLGAMGGFLVGEML